MKPTGPPCKNGCGNQAPDDDSEYCRVAECIRDRQRKRAAKSRAKKRAEEDARKKPGAELPKGRFPSPPLIAAEWEHIESVPFPPAEYIGPQATLGKSLPRSKDAHEAWRQGHIGWDIAADRAACESEGFQGWAEDQTGPRHGPGKPAYDPHRLTTVGGDDDTAPRPPREWGSTGKDLALSLLRQRRGIAGRGTRSGASGRSARRQDRRVQLARSHELYVRSVEAEKEGGLMGRTLDVAAAAPIRGQRPMSASARESGLDAFRAVLRRRNPGFDVIFEDKGVDLVDHPAPGEVGGCFAAPQDSSAALDGIDVTAAAAGPAYERGVDEAGENLSTIADA